MTQPQTFQELIKAHGKAAMELSGAGQSAWNGIVQETDNGILGVANWNGTLELDQVTVTDPLRKMYATPGVQHDAATLDGFRDAFATMLHEQSHFHGPVGASQQDAKIGFQTPGAQQLEEGVTEAWTQDNLDEYLTELGADQVAPGIENAHAQKAYPEFVPAARELAAGIGARTGQSEGEVLTALNAQTAAGQWSTATEMLYNSSDLPQVVPPDQESNVKNSIEQAMRSEFERVDNLGNVGSHNKEILSASIGQDTVTAGLEEIHRQEQTFAPPEAATLQTPTVQPELAVAAETGPGPGVQDAVVENTANTPSEPGLGADGGQAVDGQTDAGPTSPQAGAGVQQVGTPAAGGPQVGAGGQQVGAPATGGPQVGAGGVQGGPQVGPAAAGGAAAGPAFPPVGASVPQAGATAPGGPQAGAAPAAGGQQVGAPTAGGPQVGAGGAQGGPQVDAAAASGAAAGPAFPPVEAGGQQVGAPAAGGPQVGAGTAAGGQPAAAAGGAAGGPAAAAGGQQAGGVAQGGAAADTARAMALAMDGQRPLGRTQRLRQESFGSQRGGDQGAGRSHGTERPSDGRGGQGE